MARIDRLSALQALEQHRGSTLVTYVTGDRNPAGAQIGDDALRPMYEVLRGLGHVPKVDLLIYSRGGALDVPWRIASALRKCTDEWNILIPFRANSAATLLALGADEIVLGAQGELGPIDPIMNFSRRGDGGSVMQDTINVEDVMAYLRFIQERVGLTDQAMLSTGLTALTDRLDAVLLGSAFRTHSHIRDVAHRMLTSRKDPPSDRVMQTIVETLAERVYAHGHAIGLGEAGDIGLPVIEATQEEDDLMWAVLGVYEEDMHLRAPLDPMKAVATQDIYAEEVVLAVIETVTRGFEFQTSLEVTAKRAVPASFNLSLNLNNLQVPTLPPAAGAPAGTQPAVDTQALQALIAQLAQQAVAAALKAQAPLQGAEVGLRGSQWVDVT